MYGETPTTGTPLTGTGCLGVDHSPVTPRAHSLMLAPCTLMRSRLTLQYCPRASLCSLEAPNSPLSDPV
jgi:hypothetical protein